MKLKEKSGETLVETLAALLIATLSSAMLASAVLSSSRILKKIGDEEKRMKEEMEAVELSEETRDGTIMVISETGERVQVRVQFTGKEGGILGYVPYDENDG